VKEKNTLHRSLKRSPRGGQRDGCAQEEFLSRRVPGGVWRAFLALEGCMRFIRLEKTAGAEDLEGWLP